jgi:hypothetical protein
VSAAAFASAVVILATSCGNQKADPFTAEARGTVAVNDRRGDTLTEEMDIVRARLTLSRGRFVATITTVKPVKEFDVYTVSGISAGVSIHSGGEDWSVDGTYWTNGEAGDARRVSTYCEAVKGIDFEHKYPCQVSFDGHVATVRFRASLVSADDKVEVQFTTAKSHESDAAPNDPSDNESGHVDLVVTSA